MECETITSNRGRELLLVNNFKFYRSKVLQTDEVYWRCVQRTCKANVFTVRNNLIVRSNLTHNHNIDVKKLNRQLITTSCKRAASEDLAEKPSKIIRRELRENLPTTITTTDVDYIRKNLYNARRKHLPYALPSSAEELHTILSKLDIKTNRNENFLFINDDKENIVAFSCATNLRILCNIETVYVDGTFTYCPKFFTQMFTIHGFENGHYIPLIFCLLPNKRKSTYIMALRAIKEQCFDKFKVSLEPKKVVCDFEIAIHVAIKAIWPNAGIIGCRFHLCQAWYRKIQHLGLSSHYNSKEMNEIQNWLKTTFALTYLPPEEIGDAFAMDLFAEIPDHAGVHMYADYLLENYISDDADFPPHIWAENNATLVRTTNACESFHAHFNESFYSSHPTIYIFLEKLKEFQIDTYIKIQSLEITAKIHNNKVKRRQEFISSMILKLRNGEIQRHTFLKIISHHSAPKG